MWGCCGDSHRAGVGVGGGRQRRGRGQGGVGPKKSLGAFIHEYYAKPRNDLTWFCC